MKEFTAIELNNFHQYEEVRSEGLYNMFSPQAIQATELTKSDYMFVINNYSELKTAIEMTQ